MRKILFIFFTLLSLENQAQQNSQVYWSKDRKLAFGDFQKFIPIDSSIGGVCASHIEVSKPQLVDGKLAYTVYAIFEKLESGLAQRDSSSLKHEQGHFDICEIGARKIRQYIANNNILDKKVSASFSTKLQEYYQNEQNMQNMYDSETINGADYEQQKLWFKKITAMLNELNRYEQ